MTNTRGPGLARRAVAALGRLFSPGRVAAPPAATRGYPGDFTGSLHPAYDPRPDGRPDPGEIVWTWVPYEEDHSQGKDRPVLLVGRDGPWLLALQLTSKDHDGRPERRGGPRWVDIGAGPWDRQRRPSEVRVDRVVRVSPEAVRREGAVLGRERFELVAAALRDARG
jgi:PemK-like, MazF-like toxin of type II toxin-antitoxin system